jgi:pyridoxamine 5'-phosphate oxidase
MSLITSLRSLFTLGKGMVVGLPEATAGRDPIELFGAWFTAAKGSGIVLPESMALATATSDGRPSARMVLLKGYDQRGFVFFGNYESRKAQELAENAHAALVMHWAVLQRQIRIEGPVTRLPTEESEAYFKTRPRGARIGAWASAQSSELESRGVLEARVKEYEEKFKDGDVPLPPFWGGYRLAPERIEFWQGRINRLHDRMMFEKQGDGWVSKRLYP